MRELRLVNRYCWISSVVMTLPGDPEAGARRDQGHMNLIILILSESFARRGRPRPGALGPSGPDRPT